MVPGIEYILYITVHRLYIICNIIFITYLRYAYNCPI